MHIEPRKFKNIQTWIYEMISKMDWNPCVTSQFVVRQCFNYMVGHIWQHTSSIENRKIYIRKIKSSYLVIFIAGNVFSGCAFP